MADTLCQTGEAAYCAGDRLMGIADEIRARRHGVRLSAQRLFANRNAEKEAQLLGWTASAQRCPGKR